MPGDQFAILKLRFSIARFAVPIACLLALWLVPGSVRGAGQPLPPKPLKVAIVPITPRSRSQAPQTVDVRIGCISPRLFTGRLELKWYVGFPNKRLVHEYLSNELTVTDGGLTFRMLVPQIVVRAEKTAISVGARFHMDRETIDLDEPPIPTFPAVWKRAFLMGIVQPQELLVRQAERDAARERGAPFERSLTDALQLEQFNPIGSTLPQLQLDSSLDLLTYPSRLTPEDMPASTAGYASFDLLVVEGAGFEQLTAKQLAAMGQWVAAGGRVVVWPSGKVSRDHVDFLNRLAGVRPAAEAPGLAAIAPYARDDRGKLVIGERARQKDLKYARHVTGLGRSLIIHEALNPDGDFSTPEWKGTVAFLWNIRQAQLEDVTKTGLWKFDMATDRTGYRITRPYAPQPDDLARSVREFLLPERIEGVPLPVVVVILGLYLLTIAPGDYFLLGRLNLRKHTWVAFVLVSAAFTWCTVLVAKNYMGHADYHTSLTFADLAESAESDHGPQVVRTNRFDMLFVAQQGVVEIPVRNALYADLTDRAVLTEKLLRERDRRPFVFADNEEMDVSDDVITDLPLYSGVMPTAYSVHQQMRQWSPRVNRRTTIGNDPELLTATKIDWSALRPDDWHTAEGQRLLRAAILAKEPHARILLSHGNRIDDITNEPAVPGSDIPPPAGIPLLAQLVQSASVRLPLGMFAVVSQIAPTGGEFLEDLSLLDGSNPEQWLLSIALRRDNDWIVYRRLFGARSR